MVYPTPQVSPQTILSYEEKAFFRPVFRGLQMQSTFPINHKKFTCAVFCVSNSSRAFATVFSPMVNCGNRWNISHWSLGFLVICKGLYESIRNLSNAYNLHNLLNLTLCGK